MASPFARGRLRTRATTAARRSCFAILLRTIPAIGVEQCGESGKAGFEANIVRVGGEHAGHERRDDRTCGLCTEPARCERVHGFVLARLPRRREWLSQQCELAPPRHQIAAQQVDRMTRQRAQRPVEIELQRRFARTRRRRLDGEAELATPGVRTSSGSA